MSDETVRLHLPQLVSLQELNAVTWNEALEKLDGLVDLCLLGQYVNTPPASPQDGDAYLLGGAPTGAWSGYAYKIASCRDGGWRFHTPFNGLRAFVASSGTLLIYVNGAWIGSGAFTGSVQVNYDATRNARFTVGPTGTLTLDTTSHLMKFGTGSGSLVAGWGTRTTGFFGVEDDSNGMIYGLRATSNTLTDPVSGYSVVGFYGFYDGMGLSGSSNYNADPNPVFGVNAKDQLAGTNYGVGHNLFNVQNSGYVSTYNTVLDDGTGNMRPGSDNAKTLGAAANRWAVAYAGTGTINTSDEREKQWRGALNADEIAAGREILAEIGGFKFLDAVAQKGEAGARLHIGVRAQRIRDIWCKHCGSAGPLPAFLCYDAWPASPGVAAGDRWGIRTDELALFLLAVMDARMSALEAA